MFNFVCWSPLRFQNPKLIWFLNLQMMDLLNCWVSPKSTNRWLFIWCSFGHRSSRWDWLRWWWKIPSLSQEKFALSKNNHPKFTGNVIWPLGDFRVRLWTKWECKCEHFRFYSLRLSSLQWWESWQRGPLSNSFSLWTP